MVTCSPDYKHIVQGFLSSCYHWLIQTKGVNHNDEDVQHDELAKEDFKPINEKTINMYVCGPTVYNYIHIGNARSAIAFDTIRRYFEYRGYEVNYVSNFTDVDDKMIAAAAEQGITVPELADKYIDAFNEDTAPLNIKPATVRPRATEHIPEIIEFVEDLIKKGYAYESEGDVYFRAKVQGIRYLGSPRLG